MADRDLTITLKLLKTQADQAAKEFHAAEKQRVGKTLSDHDVAEKAKTAIIQREQRQRVQAIVSAHKTEIDLAKEKERAAKAGNQAINIALRAAAAEEKRIKREQANEEARLLRELAQRHKQNYRERQKEKKEQAAETKRLLKEEKEHWDANTGAILGGAKAAAGFAAGLAGLNSISSVVGQIEKTFQRTRDAIYDSAEMLGEFREGLLELAALKDRAGDTSAEMLDAVKLQEKTGQKPEDVKQLQLAFLGAAESAIGQKITKDEADKAMEGVGKLDATHAGGAGAWGKMAGMLAQTMTPKNGKAQVTGQELAEETAAMYAMTRPAQFKSIAEGAAQYAKIQSAVQNKILDSREGMALVSAFGTAEPEEAGMRTAQFIRLTMGGSTKDAQGRIIPMEGVDAETQAKYQKRIGITEDMGPEQRGKLMAADFNAAEANAKARGQAFNPIAYAKTVGMQNEGERNAMLSFRGMLNSGIFSQFEGMENDPNLGKGEIAKAEEKIRTDPALMRRRSKAAEEIATMSVGIKDEEQKAIRRSHYAANWHAGMPTFEEAEKAGWMNPIDKASGFANQIGTDYQLMDLAKQYNIPFKKSEGWLFDGLDDAERQRLTGQIKSAGVDIIGLNQRKVNANFEANLQDAGMVGGGQNGGGQFGGGQGGVAAQLGALVKVVGKAAEAQERAAQAMAPKRARPMAGKPAKGLAVQAGQEH